MNVSLTREQAELLMDALEQAEQSMNFGGLRNRFKPSVMAPIKKKLAEALQIDKRRTTEGNMRVKVGECALGVRQAGVLRYVGVYPQLACAPHITHALSLYPTHAFVILRDLQEKGLVRERKWAQWMPVGKGRPRKYYELTREGRVAFAGMPRDPAPKQERTSPSEGNWVEWMQANA